MYHEKNLSVVFGLVLRLKSIKSWAGETHIQKCLFAFQQLSDSHSGYLFELHLYGPYSRALHNDLISLNADGYLKVLPSPPYGPSWELSDVGIKFLEKYPVPKVAEPFLEYVTESLGKLSVVELEKIATALLIKKEMPDGDPASRSQRLVELKPHVSLDDANAATDRADAFVVEARVFVN